MFENSTQNSEKVEVFSITNRTHNKVPSNRSKFYAKFETEQKSYQAEGIH